MKREPQFKPNGGRAREPVRILLLEDDPDFAELLRLQLRTMRFVDSRLELAGRLSEALARLAAESFGLVLADLNLPDSGGEATVQALAEVAEQPIIVLTADRDPTLRARCMELGAYDFLSKDQLTAAALERLVRLAAIQANTHRLLAETERRFSRVLALSSDWYWEQDEHFRYTRFEGRMEEFLASDSRALLGKCRWEVPTNESVSGAWAEHRAVLEAHLPFRNFETRRLGDDGALHYVSASGEPVFDTYGNFRGYWGVATDITERKRAENALRESEQRFRSTFELAGSGMAHIGMDRRFLRVNRRLCEILGYPKDVLLQLTGRQISHPDDLDVINEQRPRLYAGEIDAVRLEKRYLRKDGSTVWVKFTMTVERDAHGKPLYEIGVYDDITAEREAQARRMQAELALAQSEAWFRQTFELAGSGIAHVDLNGMFLRVNRRVCEILGYAEKELVGRSVKDISHPEDRDLTDEKRARMRAGEAESVQMEKRYLRRDGSTVWVELTVALARDAQGVPLYEISIMEDVSERKAAEAALRESEARFRSLTELSADFYWETDARHRVAKVVHGAHHRTINARGSQLGKARWEIPSTRPDATAWAEHRATLEAHLPFRDFELARLDLEGVERHLSISGEPVFDGAGAFIGYRGVGKEITARKRDEALLALEHNVTLSLAEAPDAAAGLKAVMRAICETHGWPCGRYFAVDEEAGVLRFAEAWGRQDPAVERFLAAARDTVYARGRGLSGSVWQSGEPLWVRDVSKDPRASGSSRAALEGGAFVFPLTSAGKTIGVMSFSSADVRAPDARLLQAVRVIGSQVGQFLMRKQAERKERRRAEDLQRFRAAMDMSLDAIYLVDRASMRFVDVNKVGCKWIGYTREELLQMGPHDVLAVPRGELEREYDAAIAEGARGTRIELPYVAKDGRRGWTELHRRALRSGERWIIVTISRDITERKLAEERQAAHLRHQQRIARFGQSALAKREPAELIGEAVQTVLEALGADAVAYLEPGPGAELVVRALVGVAGDEAAAVVPCAAQATVHQALRGGTRMLGAGAELGLAWARGLESAAYIPVRGEARARGALCVFQRQPADFSAEALNFAEAAATVLSTGLQRIDSETRLAFLAQFDPLTGLPNRTLLADRFSQMIVQAKRRASPLAVLFIDLDQFKLVNDTLGHAGGDALLKEVAVRLQSTVRSGDTVARISGDEFAIVLADLARADDAALVAQKVIDRLGAPVELQGKEVFVTASVGIAAFPADGADAESLIGAADAAMYRAKQAGRGAYQFFTAEINQRSRARAQMGTELRRALEREEFTLAYQPKYDLATRRPKGAEALLRWGHPERGPVPPVEFIPVLEETGLIMAVGDWVMRRVCADLKAWQAAGAAPGPVSVNLSARQFRQEDLDARIKSLVSAAGIDPALIELEITESQLMQDPDHAIRVMRALREAGMRIAIDDFGTGYSSLAYLTRFPVGALKIDRSFVKDMSSDTADATIVRTIIEMAHSLGFTVVAEGVETEEQATFLRLLRCEQAQGFLFARPMPAAELAALFRG